MPNLRCKPKQYLFQFWSKSQGWEWEHLCSPSSGRIDLYFVYILQEMFLGNGRILAKHPLWSYFYIFKLLLRTQKLVAMDVATHWRTLIVQCKLLTGFGLKVLFCIAPPEQSSDWQRHRLQAHTIWNIFSFPSPVWQTVTNENFRSWTCSLLFAKVHLGKGCLWYPVCEKDTMGKYELVQNKNPTSGSGRTENLQTFQLSRLFLFYPAIWQIFGKSWFLSVSGWERK